MVFRLNRYKSFLAYQVISGSKAGAKTDFDLTIRIHTHEEQKRSFMIGHSSLYYIIAMTVFMSMHDIVLYTSKSLKVKIGSDYNNCALVVGQ